MKKRKHRVVLEITLDEPCSAKKAAWFVNHLIGFCETRSQAGSSVLDGITKIGRAKQFTRVFASEVLKAENAELDKQMAKYHETHQTPVPDEVAQPLSILPPSAHQNERLASVLGGAENCEELE